MDDAQEAAIAEFTSLVIALKADVEDGSLAGLDLLRRLRSDLADLYAIGPRLPRDRARDRPLPHFELGTQEAWAATKDGLVQRLPSQLYWTALLPRTYLTVGETGTQQLAAEVTDVLEYLEDGLRLEVAGTPRNQLDWWSGSWEVSWGGITIRVLTVLHEVINDLEGNIYGR